MYRKRYLLIGGFMMLAEAAAAQSGKIVYPQDIKTEIRLPAEAGREVIRLFAQKEGITALTATGIFRYAGGKWTGGSAGQGWLTAAMDPEEKLWLAAARTVRPERGGQVLNVPLPAGDSILCLYWEDSETLHAGTTRGLFTWKKGWKEIIPPGRVRVNGIVRDTSRQLWLATSGGLWRRAHGKWINLDQSLMDPANESRYYTITTLKDGADVVFATPKTVSCIAADGNHWVARGADGLPYGPANIIRQDRSELWIGTPKGAIRSDGRWHYYAGKRWLPDDKVNDILILDSATVWVATPGGIAQIRRQAMTLEQKADSIEKVIAARHNREGLINRAILKVPGNLSGSYMENEDNDGLWTACYLAAECFRYAATKDPGAKANAVRTFEALERLEAVTGIQGYPARSYASASVKVVPSRSPHPKYWHTSPDGKWQWLDDTSSDEITGHLFTLPLFYDLVADAGQKERVRKLIGRVVSHIVDNDFHLIDFDGKPTRWGIWHPDSLNHSSRWMYERGLNSLQILSFLKTAHHFTGDTKFERAYQQLTEVHGYAENAVQAKKSGPYETSHSDDILNFFPYYYLLRYTTGDPHREKYVQSLIRSWNVVRPDRMPVWNVFASALLGKDCDLHVALEEIREYPIDLINWRMENSHRWDLQRDPLVSRTGRLQAVTPVPTPESGISRWNTNPRQLDVGDGGATEDAGTFFLFAYWMGRYYGYWE